MAAEPTQRRRSYRHLLERYAKELPRNRLAEPGPHPFVVVLDHLKPGFNIAKIFRSADAFGGHEVHLIDIGPFNPAPAKGSFRHVPARWYHSVDESFANLRSRGYTLYALDVGAESSVFETRLAERSAFIMGHEEFGLSFDLAAYPDVKALSIPQFGHVHSLNVSVAASILMYEYVRQRQA
jgi:tRNA G18 (ribose-2'-O)-methylase SpoU